MKTSRLEAFSDGVLAIIITIMVLELKVPDGTGWDAIRPLIPIFATYVMSFGYLAIYWNNHHHMLQLTEGVNGWVLWANMHLLFWLSLIPFVTGWMGENNFAPLPTAMYCGVLFLALIAWRLLQNTVVRCQGSESKRRPAVGRDLKAKISSGHYAVAIGLTFLQP